MKWHFLFTLFFLKLICASGQCDSSAFEKTFTMTHADRIIEDRILGTYYSARAEKEIIKRFTSVIDTCNRLSRAYLYRGYFRLCADSMESARADFDYASVSIR